MIRKRWRAALGAALTGLALAACTTGSAAADQSDAPNGGPDGAVVHVDGGAVRGTVDQTTARFQGVPYAAAPVGGLRWRSPRPVQPWTGVRDATRPAKACAQQTADLPADQLSEDCLYLNVTAPARPRNAAPKPVMVWLHGGGVTTGTGSEFDPARMAAQGDVVVVTVDSRLGIFGYFGHPGLAGSGTFGLQDQQSALRWVRRNAGAFGGDPGNVTLFGESGGGVTACDHLVSPSAAGLFDKVILQSGSCAISWPRNGPLIGAPAGSFARPVRQVEQSGASAAAKLGCTGTDSQAALDCLRRLPTASLLPHAAEFGVVATGTPVLPRDPAKALADGQTPRVPVISGHTRDESRLIAGISELIGNPVTDQNYHQLLTEAFGARTAEVQAQYPRAGYGSAALAWSAINTDRMFACTQLTTTRELATRMPTYAYEFADENAPGYAPFPPGFPPGASHGSELLYLFDVAGKPSDIEGHPIPLTEAQRRLASAMIRYWTQFAHTGNPNGGDAPQWRQWRGGHADVQAFATGARGIGPVDDNRLHHCDFWSTFS